MLDPADEPIRNELVAAVDRCWDGIGRPGTWWDGRSKLAIAAVSRDAWGIESDAAVDALPPPARDAASMLARTPAATTEPWVRDICDAIGEPQYVELVGVVARVVAVDTLLRLLGREPLALPDPVSGEPTRTPPPDGLRRNRTWVAMAMPVPPFVLGAVPAAMDAMNDLTETLYMPMSEMGEPDWRRGELHRTQVELVAATVSHENECFY